MKHTVFLYNEKLEHYRIGNTTELGEMQWVMTHWRKHYWFQPFGLVLNIANFYLAFNITDSKSIDIIEAYLFAERIIQDFIELTT